MENEMSYGKDYKYVPSTSVASGNGIELLPDIYTHTIQIVNICLVGDPKTEDFVLIDAGMPLSADKIISVVEKRFGPNSRPKAIILTHGHFDHVGAIIELIEHWKIPVYAHELEIPYLTGEMKYPEPDPSVEGGLIAKMSALFPNEPINLGGQVEKLPENGEVPFMADFKWLHTPGHTPGHVSLFRESDRSLIVGDAFVTVKQESLYSVLTQEQEISGPPRYLTPDWETSWESVKLLEELHPSIAVTGHGLPMSGEELSNNLKNLVANFDQIAIPDHGKYISEKPKH
ncbi:MBL fold metallo-hydrolase [Salipaludibacillus sp. CF4.18]|uniref:MBL fold metallo-hydrolase n=1 Tax=Salipaludibacillus sp. CF4.18 TaxID=3373081 RepID=UPI003EE6B0FC